MAPGNAGALAGRPSLLALAGPARSAPLAGILAALLVAAFEGTVVTSAMPAIARSLGAWPVYPWAFSAFLAASMLGVLVCGRLADQRGRRPVFLGGVLGFVLASVGCAFAPGPVSFVLLRAVQGFFAGSIQPVALTISADLFSLEERARIQALFTSVWGAGNVLGPLAGGFLAAHASWRWAFLVSVPPALLAAYLLGTRFREERMAPKEHSSLAGTWVAGACAGVSLLAFDGREGALPVKLRVGCALAGLVLAAAFARVELRTKEPLLPASLRSDPHVRSGLLAGVFAGALLNVCVAYVPLWLVERHVSTTKSGAALVPLLVGWAIGSTFGVRVMTRYGVRASTTGGFALALVGALVLALSSLGAGHELVAMAGLLVLGTGIGPAASTGLVAAQTHTPKELRGAVTSLVFATRALSGALAVTALAALHTSSARFAVVVALTLGAVLTMAKSAPAR